MSSPRLGTMCPGGKGGGGGEAGVSRLRIECRRTTPALSPMSGRQQAVLAYSPFGCRRASSPHTHPQPHIRQAAGSVGTLTLWMPQNERLLKVVSEQLAGLPCKVDLTDHDACMGREGNAVCEQSLQGGWVGDSGPAGWVGG